MQTVYFLLTIHAGTLCGASGARFGYASGSEVCSSSTKNPPIAALYIAANLLALQE